MQGRLGRPGGGSGGGGSSLWSDGTISVPGARFQLDQNNGVRRIGTDEWSTVAGGLDSVRQRLGPKGYVQYGLGWMNTGGAAWSWSAVNNGTILHAQINEASASGGDTHAAVFSVTSVASSGGAGVVPDSSGMSAFFQQVSGSPNGSGRAGEFQAFRDVDTCVANEASIAGVEIGVHNSAVGNLTLYDKILGINLLFTSSGLSGAVEMADSGVYVHGDGGVWRPFFYRDERASVGVGEAFIVDYVGRVYAGPTGNAGAPAYSFPNDTDTGMFRSTTNTLAWATGGTQRMSLTSDGLGIGQAPSSGNALSVQGNTVFTSGASGTNTLFQMGRTAVEAQMVTAGGTNQYIIGSAAGDWLFRSEAGKKIMVGVDSLAVISFSAPSAATPRALIDGANATLVNRFMFQNMNTNTNTFVSVIPNGTSVDAGYAAYSNSTPTDASALVLSINNTSAVVQSTVTGTGTQRPLGFYIGATAAMTIATTGNVTKAFAEINTNMISPTIAANTDDWAPTGLATARHARTDVTGASRNLTGIVAQASGFVLTIFNIASGNNIVIKHAATSAAANQFLTPSGTDYTVPPSGAVDVIYDGTSQKWRVLSSRIGGV